MHSNIFFRMPVVNFVSDFFKPEFCVKSFFALSLSSCLDMTYVFNWVLKNIYLTFSHPNPHPKNKKKQKNQVLNLKVTPSSPDMTYVFDWMLKNNYLTLSHPPPSKKKKKKKNQMLNLLETSSSTDMTYVFDGC